MQENNAVTILQPESVIGNQWLGTAWLGSARIPAERITGPRVILLRGQEIQAESAATGTIHTRAKAFPGVATSLNGKGMQPTVNTISPKLCAWWQFI